MQLAAHETHDLHELIVSCVNSISNMACFINQVQDGELRRMLQEHFPQHVKDYNLKVEFVTNQQGPGNQLPVPQLNPNLQSFTTAPTTNFPAVTPRTDIQQFNDREIATAYLLTLKRAGREYAWATMEAANPNLRSLFENAFLMSSHHAFDVWQWMVRQGYYPLEPASQNTLSTLAGVYNAVQQPQPVGIL